MRKRLRKKLRVAEFTQMGFTVRYQPRPGLGDSELEALLDRFVHEAIEVNDLHCGGGGSPEGWDFFVCANGRRSATDRDRLRVRDWLESQADVTNILVTQLQDAWHGGGEEPQEPPGKHAA
jgi:uncharacterized protein YggL (DUF469 family)